MRRRYLHCSAVRTGVPWPLTGTVGIKLDAFGHGSEIEAMMVTADICQRCSSSLAELHGRTTFGAYDAAVLRESTTSSTARRTAQWADRITYEIVPLASHRASARLHVGGLVKTSAMPKNVFLVAEAFLPFFLLNRRTLRHRIIHKQAHHVSIRVDGCQVRCPALLPAVVRIVGPRPHIAFLPQHTVIITSIIMYTSISISRSVGSSSRTFPALHGSSVGVDVGSPMSVPCCSRAELVSGASAVLARFPRLLPPSDSCNGLGPCSGGYASASRP